MDSIEVADSRNAADMLGTRIVLTPNEFHIPGGPC
jgi:hypothetical protein